MLRFQHTAMATQFEVRCTHADARYARQAARAAFAEVDRLEQQLSRFVENSDIARVNHLAPGEWTVVAYETMQCLRLAALLHEETGGAFDPTRGAGFRQFELLPGEFVVRRRELPQEASGPEADRGGTLTVDLGAIGKGYAVDLVAAVLEDWEVREALVDAGASSVLALDPPEGEEGWPLTLSRPGEAGEVLVRMAGRHQALGASGIAKGDHIVDPRTSTPVRHRQAAWMAADRSVLADIGLRAGVEQAAAAVADALSTAFMIATHEEIDTYCGNHPGIEAWVLEGAFLHFPGHERMTERGGADEPER